MLGKKLLGSSKVWCGTAAIAFLITIAPILAVTYPPLLDYPNHLARSFILANLDDPVLSTIYEANWRYLPNLAYDLVMSVLTAIAPAPVAGKIFIFLMFLAQLGGVVALHFAIHRQLTPIPFIAILFLVNYIFFMGFLAYYLSSAIVLLGLAAWVWMEDHPAFWRLAVGTGFGLLLVVFHLYAFGAFAFLVGAYEASRLVVNWRKMREIAARLLLAGIAFVPAVAVFLLFAPTGDVEQPFIQYISLQQKLLLPRVVTDTRHDIYMVPAFAPIIALGAMALVTRQALFGRRWTVCVLAGAALCAIMPFKLMSSFNADWRLVPIVFAVLIAAIRPSVLPNRLYLPLAGWILVVAILQSALLMFHWREHVGVQKTLVSCVGQHVGPGDAMILALLGGAENQALNEGIVHTAALGVIEARTYAPNLFTHPFQQPLVFSPEYQRRNDPGFVSIKDPITPPPQVLQGFDFAFAIDMRQPGSVDVTAWPNLAAIHAEFVCGSARAGLYRISPSRGKSRHLP